MKGIYLAAFTAKHTNYDITYQDKYEERDLGGDMLDIDLSKYDFVIATPPCNYYSRANWRRETSKYSQETKHLLPSILDKLNKLEIPWIVENVRNKKLMKDFYYNAPYTYVIGRHTYWTNVKLPDNIRQDEEYPVSILAPRNRQGGQNVWYVIEAFLKKIHNMKGENNGTI